MKIPITGFSESLRGSLFRSSVRSDSAKRGTARRIPPSIPLGHGFRPAEDVQSMGGGCGWHHAVPACRPARGRGWSNKTPQPNRGLKDHAGSSIAVPLRDTGPQLRCTVGSGPIREKHGSVCD